MSKKKVQKKSKSQKMSKNSARKISIPVVQNAPMIYSTRVFQVSFKGLEIAVPCQTVESGDEILVLWDDSYFSAFKTSVIKIIEAKLMKVAQAELGLESIRMEKNAA